MRKYLISYPKRVQIVSPNNSIISKPYLTKLSNVSITDIIHNSNIPTININFNNIVTLTDNKANYKLLKNYNYIAELEFYYSYPDKVQKINIPVNVINNIIYINYNGFSLSITITSSTSLNINSFHMNYSNVIIKSIKGYKQPLDYETLKLKSNICLVKPYPKEIKVAVEYPIKAEYNYVYCKFWRIGNRYYRVGYGYDNQQLMTSVDGYSWITANRSWASSEPDARRNYKNFGYYCGHYFIRRGDSPYGLMYSEDGINWEIFEKGVRSDGVSLSFSRYYPVFTVNNRCIFQLTQGTNYNYTTDFQSLSYISFGANSNCYGIYYINNTYIAYYQNSRTIYTSTDFITWTKTTMNEYVYLTNYKQLIPFNCKLYGCSDHSDYGGIYCSEDGINWTKLSDTPTRALYIIQNKLIIVPSFPKTDTKLLYSIDGINFNECNMSNPPSSDFSIENTNTGSIIIIGSLKDEIYYTKDGISYEDIKSKLPAEVKNDTNSMSYSIITCNDRLWFGYESLNPLTDDMGYIYGMWEFRQNLNDLTIIPGYTEVT